MICLHGGDPTLAIFPMPRPDARTEPRWAHHSGVVDQEKYVMTVGVDTVSPLNNVQDALMEVICLAWVMAFRTTTLYKIITGSPHVQKQYKHKSTNEIHAGRKTNAIQRQSLR
jgi:hypothetical protein